jgi:hypothetical protein
MSIDDTLTERGKRYGEFRDHGMIAQTIKQALYQTPNWDRLEADQKEALDMIAHKIARILNGDPNYADSWHDIAGYATLVEKRLGESFVGLKWKESYVEEDGRRVKICPECGLTDGHHTLKCAVKMQDIERQVNGPKCQHDWTRMSDRKLICRLCGVTQERLGE